MPRGSGKKNLESKKYKRNEEEEEENIEDEIINEDEGNTKKSSKKKSSKIEKNKKNKKNENEDEDELSDLDVEDENNAESINNDEIVSTYKPEKAPIKFIDPKTPIGALKTDDVLSYLIQVGTDTLNPQLKFGALNLLRQLTGKRRRHPSMYNPPMYGSKREDYNPRGFTQRNGHMNRRNMQQKFQQRTQTTTNGDLYGDQE